MQLSAWSGTDKIIRLSELGSNMLSDFRLLIVLAASVVAPNWLMAQGSNYGVGQVRDVGVLSRGSPTSHIGTLGGTHTYASYGGFGALGGISSPEGPLAAGRTGFSFLAGAGAARQRSALSLTQSLSAQSQTIPFGTPLSFPRTTDRNFRKSEFMVSNMTRAGN